MDLTVNEGSRTAPYYPPQVGQLGLCASFKHAEVASNATQVSVLCTILAIIITYKILLREDTTVRA
jgi:hypothetical protein